MLSRKAKTPIAELLSDVIESVEKVFISKPKWFFRRIQEVVLFIPIIWKCYAWDHSYMWLIMSHWFDRMKQVHIKDPYHANNLIIAHQLLVCEQLTKRLYNNQHTENHYEEHNKRWGEPQWSFKSLNDGSDCSSALTSRSGVNTAEEKAQERKEFVNIMKHETYLINQDVDLLFKYIKKYHAGWWT